jgi:hypothetical protein
MNQEQRKLCIEIFKPVLENYKKWCTPKTEEKLGEVHIKDYMLFQKIQNSFTALESIMKYLIYSYPEYYDALLKQHDNDLADLQVNYPSNLDELLMVNTNYFHAINEYNEIFFDIINNEHYDIILKYRKIHPLMYYSVFDDYESTQEILKYEEDIEDIFSLVKIMIKKLIKSYVKMVMEESNEVTYKRKDPELSIDISV